MGIEEDVKRFEFGGLRDARLFYSTVHALLSNIGFDHAFENYFCVGKSYVGVRGCFEEFSKLLSHESNSKDVTFVEIFKGFDGSSVDAVTSFRNIKAFKGKLFDCYLICSNSTLGSRLEVRVRDRLLDEDKNNLLRLDCGDGCLTRVGRNYFFTLMSLFQLVERSKPFLSPHYAYKC